MKISICVVTLSVWMLIAMDSRSQSVGVVSDSITHESIPFVNIWIEGETTGTTSNEQGMYSFKNKLAGKRLVFSSIGYKKKTLLMTDKTDIIVLQPETIQLPEIVVHAKKRGRPKLYTVGDELKVSAVRRFFFCGESPYIVAKYFPFQDTYTKTPFLSVLEIVTSSPLEGARFNIRLYEMDEHGAPGKSVYGENIIGVAKKGTNLTRVNLADHSIVFPKTGLLVAFEFLIVEQNKYIYVNTTADMVKHETIIYTPTIGTVPIDTEGISWTYDAGSWHTNSVNKRVPQKEFEGKYSEAAIQLTLMD